MKKNIWGGGWLMERYLREVIGNLFTLNSPSPFISEFIIYLLIKPMFGVFTLTIKFDRIFLGFFQSCHRFVTLIFDKFTPPPEYMFQKML